VSGQQSHGQVGSIYSSPPKKSRWGIFHRTRPVRPPDKSGGPLWNLVKALWKPGRDRTSPVEASRVRLEPLESGLRPDKSGGVSGVR
jgi:hypothetical protein